ncbi:endoplasmic reticulum metallopeptidase 1 [Sergentomyia squamirostris]
MDESLEKKVVEDVPEGVVRIQKASELQDQDDDYPEKTKSERREFLIPFWASAIVLGVGMLIFYAGTVTFYNLPDLVRISEESAQPDRFIGERARNMLQDFVEIGQKVVGSDENEVQAIDFLLREIDAINTTKNSAHTIEVDVSVHDGAFTLGSKTAGTVSMYHQLQNLIVRVRPSSGPADATLLVNSHFDTVPTSPGASDAGIMVMVMIETLRKIVQTSESCRHNVVFLFNGAEEIGLKAAHGFITQHPWRLNITALVNLDSTGSGGREILFQAGPGAPWLLNLYAKYAKHPYGAAMGEELFQNGLVPSDTDFRIFRDFGGVQGLDLAFAYNGYVYHTKWDRFETIHEGTYQHTGDNVLSLVKGMANAHDLDINAELPSGSVVFFDFNGWFMISYTEMVAMIINSLITILLIVIIGFSVYSMTRDQGISFGAGLCEQMIVLVVHLVSIGVGIGLALLLMVIYDAAGRSLSYYSEVWLLYGIYFSPFYMGLALGPTLYFTVRKKLPFRLSQEVQLFLHSQGIILAVLMLIMTGLRFRSAYILLIPVIFYCASSGISTIFRLVNCRNISWIYFHILGQVLPMLFFAYLSTIAFTTFIPMAARGGPQGNPDLLISIFACGMAFFLGGFIVPLIGLCTRRWVVYGCIFGLFFLVGIILLATPIGFPYRPETSPQRYWIFHTSRTFYEFPNNNVRKTDSGYILLPMDRHSDPAFVEDYVPQMSKAVPVADDCAKEILCGIPLYSGRMLSQAHLVNWIPTDEPFLDGNISVSLVAHETSSNRMLFEVEGPSRVTIYIVPAPGVRVRAWSFMQDVPAIGISGIRRNGHFIVRTAGKVNQPFPFWIELDRPANWDSNQYQVSIGISGHFTHHDEQKTTQFRSFIDSFPDWTDVTAWTTGYKVYEF